jgi:HAD superfamily hydrolase (TIGR01484 family)
MEQISLLSDASTEDLKKIQGICFDIDDTFSTKGKITSEAFASLWELKKAGFVLVPVTGRPAGWCDHIARFWPVDAVIGENGAFVFYMEKSKRCRLDILDETQSEKVKNQLGALARGIEGHFPNARYASDQHYREYDLAIDVCEDVPSWSETEIDRLLEYCQFMGAHAKLSSVHVNTWFGNYDKQRMMQFWLQNNLPGAQKKITEMDSWIYIGDSPNDAPAFAFFKYSVGVANLCKYFDRLTNFPTWLTTQESGAGFAELAQKLISVKN